MPFGAGWILTSTAYLSPFLFGAVSGSPETVKVALPPASVVSGIVDTTDVPCALRAPPTIAQVDTVTRNWAGLGFLSSVPTVTAPFAFSSCTV